MNFTIGADPELFLIHKPTNKLVSAVGLIGGSKESPLPIGNSCAIQEDNVAAEFCIPPAEDVNTFLASINFALHDLEKRAMEYGLSLAESKASAVFDEDQLWTLEAQTFGCDPDYNAYTGTVNPRPTSSNKNLRSCGGHVHIGTKYQPRDTIKVMDLFLGAPSVLLDPDTNRRALYGKAGAFRYKPYGVEYRTLSNFWIWKKDLIEWVYHQVKAGLTFIENNKITEKIELDLQNCINTNNKHLAQKFILDYNLEMP